MSAAASYSDDGSSPTAPTTSTPGLASLRDDYRAIVVGSSGGIGAAFVARLGADPRCAAVEGLHRGASVALDFDDEASIARAARALGPRGPFDLIVNAAGVLHDDRMRPEKRLAELDPDAMAASFRVNAIGPALLLKHFGALLAPERSLFVLLSARVGSIDDNRLGGWVSYRASKAALNMVVRTAAIEYARSRPTAIVVALHPGTVATRLSRPFGGERRGRRPAVAVDAMLATIDRLRPEDSGRFVAFDGLPIAW